MHQEKKRGSKLIHLQQNDNPLLSLTLGICSFNHAHTMDVLKNTTLLILLNPKKTMMPYAKNTISAISFLLLPVFCAHSHSWVHGRGRFQCRTLHKHEHVYRQSMLVLI